MQQSLFFCIQFFYTFTSHFFQMFKNRVSYNHFLEFFLLHKWGLEACEIAYNSSALQHVLNSGEKYDVILLEQFNTDCMLGVAHKLNIPYIGMSSCLMMPWHYARFGLPSNPSYIPALFMGNSEKQDFVQRLGNWIAFHGMKFLYSQFSDKGADKILNKYLGDGIPSVSELAKKTSLMLVNEHFSMSGAKPKFPSIIDIGGVHIQKQKKLDKDLQELLDTADNGVIYVSWGSMIKSETLPDDKREGIVQAFGKFPQLVLWKWGNETLTNKPKNVVIKKWLPQKEILCHPKVRVFVTHGGLLGSSEAAYCGVPTVITPMYGDQFLNSAAMVNRGMGTILQYEDISKESMVAALKKVLQPEYKANANKVSYSYKNRPQPVMETAIWWIEYVAATGGGVLTKSYASELPWYVYESFDIHVVIFTVLSICIFSWICILRMLFGSSRSSKNKKEKSS